MSKDDQDICIRLAEKARILFSQLCVRSSSKTNFLFSRVLTEKVLSDLHIGLISPMRREKMFDMNHFCVASKDLVFTFLGIAYIFINIINIVMKY